MKYKKIALAIGASLAVFGASAATQGQIHLEGTVDQFCSIEVQDYGVALDIEAGAASVGVGQVTETCNDPRGYSIQLESANGGELLNSLDASFKVAYEASFDSASSTMATPMQLQRATPQFGRSNEVAITFLPQTNPAAGAYTDDILVTIVAP